MRGGRPFVVLAICAAMAGVVLAAAVSGAAANSTTGYDISYPQCNGAFPSSPAFGIVGVNDGRVYSSNPCLGTGDGPSELGWAGMNAGLYANTANPGPALSTHWPNGQTSPQQCNTASNPGSDTAQCAYDYGWNAATDSYQDAVNAYISLGWAAAGATRTPVANAWWLDVESANSWTSNTSFNVDELQGEVDYLKSVGAASVGFYATTSDWQTITGNTTSFSAYQSWVPGASTLSEAQANCVGAGVTGGGVALTQYPSGGFDGDYRCAGASPALLFGNAPQTLTAGGHSGPMSVTLPQAASQATNVTLTSSSAAGRFATSTNGTWNTTVTLPVAAGSRATGSFYYSDTHAGQPLLTASASGYANATQTETVNAAALATVAVSPTSAQVRVGGQHSFSATGQDTYGNAVTVTPSWSVSPTTLGAFSPNPGNPVTFTAGKVSGSGTITAAVVTPSGTISGNASVSVTTKRSTQTATRASLVAPRLTMLLSVPSSRLCLSRGRLIIFARKHAVPQLVSLRVLVNGKRVDTVAGRGLARAIDLRLAPGHRYTVTLIALTRAGQRISAKYLYGACPSGQPPTLLPARPGG